MSLMIYEDKLEIYIPNSEAKVNAQHIGIKDRTVGSYYMSELPLATKHFLNELDGVFYLDLLRTSVNLDELYDYVLENNIEYLFKNELIDQTTTLMEIQNNNLGKDIIKIKAPDINEHNKYLKFDNGDKNVMIFQTLLLGDLSKIVIKKLSDDAFLVYGDVQDNFKEIICSLIEKREN